MNDNHTPDVEIESTGDGRYRVTVNGRPATGPLPRLEAAKMADVFENQPKSPPSRAGVMLLILVIASAAGLIAYLITGDSGIGSTIGVVMFLVTSVVFLFLTSGY